MLARLLEPVLEVLWPTYCAACDRPAPGVTALCALCAETLVPGAEACCPRCGVVWLDPPPDGGRHLCGACVVKPPPYAEARGAFAYGGALGDAIARWKNAPDETLGRPLSRLMLSQAAVAGWAELRTPWLVVPVPSSVERIRKRGFNPAGVLANGMSRELGLELSPLGLKLRKDVPTAKGLARGARDRRVAGAFEGDRRAVGGRPVLVVDDVITTGATVRAAARACLRAGATEVRIAALARVAF